MPTVPTTLVKLFMVEAAYGRAMLRAHGIERMLATWLICSASARDDSVSSKKKVSSIKRQTLGSLIRSFVVEAKADKDLEAELLVILHLRNELTHRISDQLADSALHEDWHENAVVNLTEIVARLTACRRNLLPYMEQASVLAGISNEEISLEIRRRYPSIKTDA